MSTSTPRPRCDKCGHIVRRVPESDYMKQWKAKNEKKLKLYHKKYYEENKEWLKANMRRRRMGDKHDCKASCRVVEGVSYCLVCGKTLVN